MIGDKVYLGDSVYCEFKGGALVLTTEDGDAGSNEIFLEPEVYGALLSYVAELRKFNEQNLKAKNN